MILLWTSAMNQSIVITIASDHQKGATSERGHRPQCSSSSYEEEESLDSLVRESLSFRDQWL
jgi:hypothetical protein